MGRIRRTLLAAMSLLLLGGLLMLPSYAQDAPPAAYDALYRSASEQAAERREPEKRQTLLEGKSILCIGDSIMAGYRLADPKQSWVSMLGSVYGMQVTNRSISGSTLTTSDKKGYVEGGCYEPFVERELPDGKFDLVLVEGGGNDWYCAAPLGSDQSSRDPKTFMGAVNVMIDRLQEKYPKAVILFMTPWIPKYREPSDHTPEMDYYEAMTQVCAARNIPCYQARDPEISGVYAGDPEFRKRYCLTESDAWHLNAEGQALFLPHIAQWLEQQTEEKVLVAGFRDVKQQDWFADSVAYAAEHQLMNGTSEKSFSPQQTMTRGMLVTVLYRAAGAPSTEGIHIPFTDLRTGSYYEDAVKWAYDRQLILGVDDTHFDPDGQLTRQQLAAILFRQAEEDETPTEEAVEETLAQYSDGTQVQSYARAAMCWAVRQGIVQGFGDNTLRPGAATRAQVAAMLKRYLERDI